MRFWVAVLGVLGGGEALVRPTRVRVERLLGRDATGIDAAHPLIEWELTQHGEGGPEQYLAEPVSSVTVIVGPADPTGPVSGGAERHVHRVPVPADRQHLAFEPVR